STRCWTSAAGVAAIPLFTLARGGTLPAPVDFLAHSVYRPDPSFDATPTYARKLTVGAERSLDVDTTVTVEYMNVAGFHLPRLRNAALTLAPQFTLEQSAVSRYQGVSVTLRRRLSKELTYLLGYTAGRARHDASPFRAQPVTPANRRA